MKILPIILIVVLCHETSSVRLIKRDLSSYSLATCNDGSTASYYYEQDVRSAGSKVLIYLPDAGHCSSVEECETRCSDNSPDKGSCSGAEEPVLELDDGVWSSNSDDNPFSDYFKVYIHSCSNDDFSGTRSGSRLTGNLNFHGKHILTSTLQDLVASFGINSAESLVLAGSGTGARAVGYNCDYVSDALHSVNPGTEVRCILDSPDFTPWWVKTEECSGRDVNDVEREHLLWGKRVDQTCMEESEKNNSELFYKCGVFSRYWKHVKTPFFLINSQYNPTYFDSSSCAPGDDDPQFAAYQLSWRRGVIALMQVLEDTRPDVGLFSANCDSHTLLSGVLTPHYWTRLTVPLFDQEQESSLSSLMFRWSQSLPSSAVDSLMRNNTQCVSAAPHRVLASCTGRLITCNSHAQLLPSALSHRSGHGHGLRRGLIRRLSPPSYIWPASYDQHRRCGLDPYYSGCGATNIVGTGCATCTSACTSCGSGTFLSSSGDRVVPESAIPAAGRKGRLWRRFYYLQYLKLLYNKLKAEYAREYNIARRHHGLTAGHYSGASLGRVISSIKIPDYNDYYDDYYDYDYSSDDIFARIVKAVKKNKAEKKRKIDPTKILLNSVQENFEFPQELLNSLPDIDDVDYEDFETLNEQVESLDRIKRKRN